MNCIQPIRQRFDSSPAEIYGRWVCEAGKTKCEVDLRSAPCDVLILSVDILETHDSQIRSSIDRQQHCDFVAIGYDDANPYLILIEVKGGNRPRASRIRRAKSQIVNSEGIAIALLSNCQVQLIQPDVYHVVVTRRIPASTMTRWHKQRDGDDLFRDVTLVFSGDDIWRTIQGR